MVVIFHFSAESQPLPELTATLWDKFLHAIEYAGLASLVFRAFVGAGVSAWPAALLTIAIVSGYGATDEWHQAYVPLRNADIRDWFTDTIGALLGIGAYWIVSTALRRRRRPRR
jgi:VanZ family protein